MRESAADSSDVAEVERLRHDLDDAREQLAATTEVLTTVGRPTPDLDAVLGTVVESARRLGRSDVAQIHLVEGNWYRLASWCGHSDEYLGFVTRRPIALDRRTLTGRVGLDRRAQQIQDRGIRKDPATAFLPIVMIAASGDQQKLLAIDAGADDFVTKPFDQAELVARVASLLRVKHYHDTIERQSAELARWNGELETRVAAQVEELERVGRFRRFLAPQLADLIVSSGDESSLESHRREITVVFCDLRGFTAFAETNEPEEVMEVLRGYHTALGDLIFRFEGTLERFTGDGLMVFFNDPVPCPDPSDRAVRMAVSMSNRIEALAEGWARRDQDLALAVGIAEGYATLGRIGFEGRFDYAAIGSVTNLAARLCAEAAPWQILVTQRVQAASEKIIVSESVGQLALHGFTKPIRAHAIRGLNSAVAA